MFKRQKVVLNVPVYRAPATPATLLHNPDNHDERMRIDEVLDEWKELRSAPDFESALNDPKQSTGSNPLEEAQIEHTRDLEELLPDVTTLLEEQGPTATTPHIAYADQADHPQTAERIQNVIPEAQDAEPVEPVSAQDLEEVDIGQAGETLLWDMVRSEEELGALCQAVNEGTLARAPIPIRAHTLTPGFPGPVSDSSTVTTQDIPSPPDPSVSGQLSPIR